MYGPIDYTKYDPQRFAEDHPDDPKLREAIEGAKQHASQIPPQQPGESPEAAQARFDEGMSEYNKEFDKGLDQHHGDQLKQLKEDHYQQQQQEINERRNAIQDTQSDAGKWHNQGERNIELNELDASYKDNFKDSPEYQAKREQLENMQGARSEAISHEIGNTPPPSPPSESRDGSGPNDNQPTPPAGEASNQQTPPSQSNGTPPAGNSSTSPSTSSAPSQNNGTEPTNSPPTSQGVQSSAAPNTSAASQGTPETNNSSSVAPTPNAPPQPANSPSNQSADYQRHMEAYKLASTPPSASPSMSSSPTPAPSTPAPDDSMSR